MSMYNHINGITFASHTVGDNINPPRIEVPIRIYLVDGENKTLIDDYLKKIVKEAILETLSRPMKRLIDADALKCWIYDLPILDLEQAEAVCNLIDRFPTADMRGTE